MLGKKRIKLRPKIESEINDPNSNFINENSKIRKILQSLKLFIPHKNKTRNENKHEQEHQHEHEHEFKLKNNKVKKQLLKQYKYRIERKLNFIPFSIHNYSSYYKEFYPYNVVTPNIFQELNNNDLLKKDKVANIKDKNQRNIKWSVDISSNSSTKSEFLIFKLKKISVIRIVSLKKEINDPTLIKEFKIEFGLTELNYHSTIFGGFSNDKLYNYEVFEVPNKLPCRYVKFTPLSKYKNEFNVSLWNVMLFGYNEKEELKKSIQLYKSIKIFNQFDFFMNIQLKMSLNDIKEIFNQNNMYGVKKSCYLNSNGNDERYNLMIKIKEILKTDIFDKKIRQTLKSYLKNLKHSYTKSKFIQISNLLNIFFQIDPSLVNNKEIGEIEFSNNYFSKYNFGDFLKISMKILVTFKNICVDKDSNSQGSNNKISIVKQFHTSKELLKKLAINDFANSEIKYANFIIDTSMNMIDYLLSKFDYVSLYCLNLSKENQEFKNIGQNSKYKEEREKLDNKVIKTENNKMVYQNNLYKKDNHVSIEVKNYFLQYNLSNKNNISGMNTSSINIKEKENLKNKTNHECNNNHDYYEPFIKSSSSEYTDFMPFYKKESSSASCTFLSFYANQTEKEERMYPKGRSGHATAIDDLKQIIYLFGGYNGIKELGCLWKHDIKKSIWTLLNDSTLYKKSCHKMLYYKEYLIIIGGYKENHKNIETNNFTQTAQIMFFCINNNCWRTEEFKCQSEKLKNFIESVFDFQAIIIDNIIYVFGENYNYNVKSNSYINKIGLVRIDLDKRYIDEVYNENHTLEYLVQMKNRSAHLMVYNTIDEKLYISGGKSEYKYITPHSQEVSYIINYDDIITFDLNKFSIKEEEICSLKNNKAKVSRLFSDIIEMKYNHYFNIEDLDVINSFKYNTINNNHFINHTNNQNENISYLEYKDYTNYLKFISNNTFNSFNSFNSHQREINPKNYSFELFTKEFISSFKVTDLISKLEMNSSTCSFFNEKRNEIILLCGLKIGKEYNICKDIYVYKCDKNEFYKPLIKYNDDNFLDKKRSFTSGSFSNINQSIYIFGGNENVKCKNSNRLNDFWKLEILEESLDKSIFFLNEFIQDFENVNKIINTLNFNDSKIIIDQYSEESISNNENSIENENEFSDLFNTMENFNNDNLKKIKKWIIKEISSYITMINKNYSLLSLNFSYFNERKYRMIENSFASIKRVIEIYYFFNFLNSILN